MPTTIFIFNQMIRCTVCFHPFCLLLFFRYICLLFHCLLFGLVSFFMCLSLDNTFISLLESYEHYMHGICHRLNLSYYFCCSHFSVISLKYQIQETLVLAFCWFYFCLVFFIRFENVYRWDYNTASNFFFFCFFRILLDSYTKFMSSQISLCLCFFSHFINNSLDFLIIRINIRFKSVVIT